MTEPLWTGHEWTFPLMAKAWEAIEKIGREDLHMDFYEPSIEIISADQMIDAYVSIGMPTFYEHWSFGKRYVEEYERYHKGARGLAFEVVSNTNPCVAYLMEDNTMTMQALTMSHASVGHSHFFKNNYLFRERTDASSIQQYMEFAKGYVRDCEERYGEREVELWLDSCHAVQSYGVDQYTRPPKASVEREKQRRRLRLAMEQEQVSDLDAITGMARRSVHGPTGDTVPKDEDDQKFDALFPEENLLYFFEKHSPRIKQWQRELLRIQRKVAGFFMPNMQSKVGNEGCATMTHWQVLRIMHERGLMTDGSWLEAMDSHVHVVMQPGFDSDYYSGINPYALGFSLLRDVIRMHEDPTPEDLKWFPTIKKQEWRESTPPGWDAVLDAAANYRDESLIRQWLSPRLAREMRLFALLDDRTDTDKYVVSNIHDDAGFEVLREKLADQYLHENHVPHLEVNWVDPASRALYLRHDKFRGRALDLKTVEEVMPHVRRLWGEFAVHLQDGRGDAIYSLN